MGWKVSKVYDEHAFPASLEKIIISKTLIIY